MIKLLILCLSGSVMADTHIDQEIDTDSLVVKTTSGRVEGFTVETPLGKSVDVFLGIPYGASTGGENRFSPPKEPTAWEDIFQAKTLPNACIQGFIPPFNFTEDKFWESNFPESDSEDCLMLNIWIPKPRKSNLPVLVWIPGAALITAATNKDLFNGAILASEEEIIVLNFNYRVSAFGFLFLDHPDVPGNVGLMDQQAALQWVQKNIERFGGDPNSVTISGQSGGAASAGYHLLLKSSHDLFKRAIMQSGNPATIFLSKSTYEASYFSHAFAKLAGCASTDPTNKIDIDKTVQCLKSKKTSEIQSAITQMNPLALPFMPVIDRSFLPSSPRVLLKEKRFCPKKQVLLGSNKQGLVLALLVLIPGLELKDDTFFTVNEIRNVTKFVIRQDCNALADAVRYHYTDWENPDDPVKTRSMFINLLTDVHIYTDNLFSDHFSTNGNHVYKYVFNHKSSTNLLPKWTGAIFGSEIPFVFGAPLDPFKGFNKEEEALTRNVMHYWANFVKHGDPNSGAKDLFHWPRYTLHEKPSLKLGLEPSVLNWYRVRETTFWDRIFPGLRALYKSPHH